MSADPRLGRLPKPPRWGRAGDSTDNWGSPRNDRIALGVIGVTIFYVIVLHPSRVSTPLLLPAVGAFVYFGMVSYQRHWWILRTRSTGGATVVRSDHSDSVFAAVSIAAVSLGFACYAALEAVGVAVPDLLVVGKRRSSVIHAAEGPSPAVCFALFFLVAAVGSLVYGRVYTEREHLVLSPQGVRVRKFPHCTTIGWDEVVDVTDFAALPVRGGRWRPSTGICIVLVMRDGPPVLIDAAPYAPKSSALFWMVRHYWSTPQQRHELGSDVALRRLMQEDFPVAPARSCPVEQVHRRAGSAQQCRHAQSHHTHHDDHRRRAVDH